MLLVLLAVGLAIAAVRGREDEVQPAARGAGAVSLVGDSLNVGIEPYLSSKLAGWRIDNRNRVGRPTREGVDVLREAGEALAPRVVVSLGTNDPASATATFAVHVRDALSAAGPRRCVVWVTIARDGDAYTGFNEVLRAEAARRDNLLLVDWAAMVAQHPEWLTGDLVHGTDQGYARRAEAVARAVERCSVARVEER